MGNLLTSNLFHIIVFLLSIYLAYRVGYRRGYLELDEENHDLERTVTKLETRLDYVQAYNDQLIRSARRPVPAPPPPDNRPLYGSGMLDAISEQRRMEKKPE